MLMVVMLATAMSACNFSNQSKAVETEPVYMEWQVVDSSTAHINLSDSACITMSVTDSVLVFNVNGIENFKIFSDTTELPIENDSNLYYLCPEDIPAGYPVTIQADSVELELDIRE